MTESYIEYIVSAILVASLIYHTSPDIEVRVLAVLAGVVSIGAAHYKLHQNTKAKEAYAQAAASVTAMLSAGDFPAAVVDGNLNVTMWNQVISREMRTDLGRGYWGGATVREGVPFASLRFVNDKLRDAATDVLARAGLAEEGQQHTLYLRLTTDTGDEADMPLVASVIGCDYGGSGPRAVALYGQGTFWESAVSVV